MSTVSAFAQQSLSDRINSAFDICFTDLSAAKNNINSIDESALSSLPDSTCFDYHYVCATIASNEGDKESVIRHLQETKRLCEVSLGIHRPVYLEIMNALASAFDDKGDYENALAIYQEGIVKGLSIRNWDDAKIEFGNLNSGLASIYEKKGWNSEVPSMWRNAWEFWIKKETNFETYNVFPLYMLSDYYNRHGDYDKALEVNKEMSDFASIQTSNTNPLWCELLYQKGTIIGHQGNYKEAVEVYRQGIIVAIQSDIQGETLEQLYGNMICSMAEYDDRSNIDIALSELKQVCPTLYSQVLFSVSYIFEKNKKYNDALDYINRALSLVSGNDKEKYEWYAGLYSHEYDNQQQLEKLCASNVPNKGSSEWFTYMEQLANAYYGDKQKEMAKDVLVQIVNEANKNKESENTLARFIDLLVGCAADVDDYSTVLEYSNEWISYAKKNFGDQSKQYYSSLNTLAVAYIKTGDYNRAKSTLELSGPLCMALFGKESEQYATELHNNGRVAQLLGELNAAKTYFDESLSIHSKIKTPLNRTARTRECQGEVEFQLREQL